MAAWLIILTTLTCAQSVLLYILLKQVGQILRTTGPVGARLSVEGPRIGENIGHHIDPLARIDHDKGLLVVLASTSCGVCDAVREGAEGLYRHWRKEFEILFVYEDRDVRTQKRGDGVIIAQSRELRRRLGIGFVPFALVATPDGTVVSKALVNHIGHLESLLESYDEKAFSS